MATTPIQLPGQQTAGSMLPVGGANINKPAGNLSGTKGAFGGDPVSNTLPTAPPVPGATGPNAGVVTVPTNTIAAPTTGISSGLSLKDGSNTLVGDFKDTYGAGTGTALAGILGNLGTSTSNATTAVNQSILDASKRQQADMAATQAAHGVSPDSSSAALANSDYAAQVNQTIASTDAGIQLNELNTLINSLQGEGQSHGHDSSWTDSFGDIGNMLGAAAGATKAGLGASAGGGSTMMSVLSALALL